MKRVFETAECEAVRNFIFWELRYEKHENQVKGCGVELRVTGSSVKGKGKGTVKPLMEVFHDTATECHLPYGITQCYLPPDTSEHAPPNPSHAGRYSIYLPGGMEG